MSATPVTGAETSQQGRQLMRRLERRVAELYRGQRGSDPGRSAAQRIRRELRALLDADGAIDDKALARVAEREASKSKGGALPMVDGRSSVADSRMSAAPPSAADASRPASRAPRPPASSVAMMGSGRASSVRDGSSRGGRVYTNAEHGWADSIREDVARFRLEQRLCNQRQKEAAADHRAALDRQVEERRQQTLREQQLDDDYNTQQREAEQRLHDELRTAEERRRERWMQNKEEQARLISQWHDRRHQEDAEQRKEDAATARAIQEKVEQEREQQRERRREQLRRMREISQYHAAREEALQRRKQQGRSDEQEASRAHLALIERQDNDRVSQRDRRMRAFEAHQQVVNDMAPQLGTKGNKAWIERALGDVKAEREEHERIRATLEDERGQSHRMRVCQMETTRRELDKQVELKKRQQQEQRDGEHRAYEELQAHISRIEERESGRQKLKKQLELEHRRDLDHQIQVRRAQHRQGRLLGC